MNVNTRGQLADSFNPNVNNPGNNEVLAVKLQSDGKVVIGGRFTTVSGQTRLRVARVNADGSLDTTFINADVGTNAFDSVEDLAIQSDGKIVIGGRFTSVAGQPRNGLARLNADGTLNANFNIGINISPNNFISSVAVQPDDKILIGGSFNSIGGQARIGIARFNADGSVDALFNPNSDSYVESIVLQPNGKILIGGSFTNVGGAPRVYIARLNADGTLDTTFSSPFPAGPSGVSIRTIALQSDGKILTGGSQSHDRTIKAVSRLNADGTFDAAFNQNIELIDGSIYAIAVQANGKILIGGIIFSPVPPFRLNADGTRDVLYYPGPKSGDPNGLNASIYAIAVQPDQKILVSGSFDNIGSLRRNRIARLLSDSPFTGAARFDFDGDLRADISAFRPFNGTWFIYQSGWSPSNTGAIRRTPFGFGSDRLAPADYDGDFKTDIAVFREGEFGYFYILNSLDNTFRYAQFGTTDDIPVPGDWDGDRKADVAVYRNGGTAGAQSYFYYRPSGAASVNFRQIVWGATGDKPVVGDFDGDGKQDAAVFRPSNGVWYVSRSSDNQLQAAQFGIASDKIVAADYDGDNKTDYAVYRAGTWYLLRSQLGFIALPFGVETDVPTPADYDGDNKTDLGVFRNGTWYLNRSSAGPIGGIYSADDDKPIPNAFVQ